MGADIEFRYRVPWHAPSGHPGSHRGRQRGDGTEVRALLPLYAAGDPRRIDLQASLRDPHGQLLVRNYRQSSSIAVHALADVSASMQFSGHCRKYDLLVDFVTALALSAARAGDRFALAACDTGVVDNLSLPLLRGRGAAEDVLRRLRAHLPGGTGADGLLDAAARIGAGPAIVFVVSDFHFPVPLLRELMARLGRHSVIPVILVDSAEARMPKPGIATLRDPETGESRTVLMRRAWAERLRRNYAAAEDAVRRCLAGFELRPLYLVDRYDADAVNRYFLE